MLWGKGQLPLLILLIDLPGVASHTSDLLVQNLSVGRDLSALSVALLEAGRTCAHLLTNVWVGPVDEAGNRSTPLIFWPLSSAGKTHKKHKFKKKSLKSSLVL